MVGQKPAKPPKPWDVFPIKAKGDPGPEPLFLAVGAALTAWERMEDMLGFIFGNLVGSRRNAATAAFGTVVSSQARAQMVVAAAQIILRGDPLLDEIDALINEIGQLAGRRNDIAHGMVSSFTATDNGVTTEHGNYLIPPHYNTRKKLPPDVDTFAIPYQAARKYAYTADQIAVYVDHFSAYRIRLRELMFRVQKYCNEKWPPQ